MAKHWLKKAISFSYDFAGTSLDMAVRDISLTQLCHMLMLNVLAGYAINAADRKTKSSGCSDDLYDPSINAWINRGSVENHIVASAATIWMFVNN